jgi:hemolysin activation/secretion protein
VTLMKFSPETVRLRRVAKAYAAGEFSRSEYRATRREVIANFRADASSDDDTQRRDAVTVGSGAAVDPDQPRGRSATWLVMVALTMMVLGLVALEARAGTVIGAVSERSSDPMSSPRLAVRSLRVRAFQPYPGVLESDLNALIDDALDEIRRRNAEGDHGFTRTELDEVGRFLSALGAHRDGGALSATDAEDLMALIEQQKARRGISVLELEEIAGRVQAYYRDAGYFLAVAYLPAQQVEHGIVEVGVLPGVLGDVVVTGVDQKELASRFEEVVGEPVTEESITRRVYLLNQVPGLKAQAAFEPGSEVGETRLNVNVVEQRKWSARVIADNHGDDATGKERLSVVGGWFNPRGVGDVLEVGLLQTVNPTNQTYGFIDYRTPIGGVRQAHVRASTNSFTASDGVELDGSGALFDVGTELALRRSRASSLTARLGVSHHRFSWATAQDQAATFLSAGFDGHRLWDDRRVAAGFGAVADAGRFGDGTFAGQDATFWRLGLNAYAWRALNVPGLPGEQKLAARLLGQLSGSQLPSSRRLSLGGFGRVRGFERDAFLADRGALLSLELRTPVPLGEMALFADTSYGEGLNDLTPAWGHLTSLGVGWDADLLPRLTSRVSLALPVAAKGSGDMDDKGFRIFWQLQYEH